MRVPTLVLGNGSAQGRLQGPEVSDMAANVGNSPQYCTEVACCQAERLPLPPAKERGALPGTAKLGTDAPDGLTEPNSLLAQVPSRVTEERPLADCSPCREY